MCVEAEFGYFQHNCKLVNKKLLKYLFAYSENNIHFNVSLSPATSRDVRWMQVCHAMNCGTQEHNKTDALCF